MGKPAARVGDMHDCPRVTPGTGMPHVGGKIIGPGCASVLIEGLPAATVGDVCFCTGEPDMIVTGSSGVHIGGKLIARQGDLCAHGGNVVSGSSSVLIGGGCLGIFLYEAEDDTDKKEKFVEPSVEDKIRFINQAIADSIVLLERKLKMLGNSDSQTLIDFGNWFGRVDNHAKEKILQRIGRALNASKKLTVGNFDELIDEKARRETCAIAYSEDELYRFKIGSVFWKVNANGKDSKSGAIVHELSHFMDIGGTEDVIYGEKDCLALATVDPNGALKNATSFEYFVTM